MASVPAAVPRAAVPAKTGSRSPLKAARPNVLKLRALTCIARLPRRAVDTSPLTIRGLAFRRKALLLLIDDGLDEKGRRA